MAKINLNFKSDKYLVERSKYEKSKRFKVVKYNQSFTATERNKFYIPKAIIGIFISIISLGIAPLYSKTVRKLLTRKIIDCTQIDDSKSMANVSKVSKDCLYQTEKMIPHSQMPEDMINLMTQFLEPKEIAGLKAVNKDWNNYITENKSVEVIFGYVELMLKKETNPTFRLAREMALIEAIAQIDIEKAKLLAQTSSERDLALIGIVRIEAKKDINKAKETLQMIQKRHFKDDALIEIIRAKAEKDLEIAIKQAQKFTNTETRDRALSAIVEVESKKDIARAKELIKEIQGNFWKDAALIRIVKEEAKLDLVGAKKTAQMISKEYSKDRALLEIVKNLKIETKKDLLDAFGIHAMITDGSLRHEAFYEIAKIKAQTDFNSTKQTAIQMHAPDGVFLEIVKIEAQTDIKSAKKTVLNIDKHNRSKALLEIVKAEALKDLKAAKKTAQSIPKEKEKNQAFVEIVKAEAQYDLENAKKRAQKIVHELSRNQAFFEIVKIEAHSNLVSAQETARLISTTPTRIDAFIEILLAMGTK